MKIFAFLVCLLASFLSLTAHAEPPAKAAVCVACHGANGISAIDIYPNLAGQKKAYLLSALNAYKSGTRPDPIMQAMSATLTDEDMEELANYYANLKP